MSYWKDLAGRQKRLWKNKASRIVAYIKSNYRSWAATLGAILLYVGVFGSQTGFILWLTKDIKDPTSSKPEVLLMPFGIAIGIIIAFVVVCVELCFWFDYQKFKERQCKIYGEMWRRRQEE